MVSNLQAIGKPFLTGLINLPNRVLWAGKAWQDGVAGVHSPGYNLINYSHLCHPNRLGGCPGKPSSRRMELPPVSGGPEPSDQLVFEALSYNKTADLISLVL
jgi:hypothetical protein